MPQAVAEYGVLLKMDPQHQCYYQREIALWLHRHLDAEVPACPRAPESLARAPC
jgi:hypothetical protein